VGIRFGTDDALEKTLNVDEWEEAECLQMERLAVGL
jgi:hypothetical protein